MPSGRWESCTLRWTILFLVPSNIQHVQQVHHPLTPSPPSISEGPFSHEVGPSRVVWRNCCLARYVGAFSQLLRCFSKLLARLIVLPQREHFEFHSAVASVQLRWRKISSTSCICDLLFRPKIPSVAQSATSRHQSW